MVERILGISPVKKVEYYNPEQQGFKNSFNRKDDQAFQKILDRKMKADVPSQQPYRVTLSK